MNDDNQHDTAQELREIRSIMEQQLSLHKEQAEHYRKQAELYQKQTELYEKELKASKNSVGHWLFIIFLVLFIAAICNHLFDDHIHSQPTDTEVPAAENPEAQ